MLPYPQALADGIGGPPVEPRDGLADHYNRWGALAVGVRKDSPAVHRNAERREVIRCDDLHVEHRVGGGLFGGLSLGRELAVHPPGPEKGPATTGETARTPGIARTCGNS